MLSGLFYRFGLLFSSEGSKLAAQFPVPTGTAVSGSIIAWTLYPASWTYALKASGFPALLCAGLNKPFLASLIDV